MSEPRPMVRHKGGIRIGRGFSLGEMRMAGLNLDQIRKLKIPIDYRRKSYWPENVEALKKLLAPHEES